MQSTCVPIGLAGVGAEGQAKEAQVILPRAGPPTRGGTGALMEEVSSPHYDQSFIFITHSVFKQKCCC